MAVKLVGGPLAVEKERAARLYVVDDLVSLQDVGRVVACDEVCLGDVVRALDRSVAEAQVRDGHAAGLFGVILEVSLYVLVGVVADDLDGVLVCADGSVAAETPELACDRSCGSGIGAVLLGEGKSGNVVDDSEGEVILGLVCREILECCEYG